MGIAFDIAERQSHRKFPNPLVLTIILPPLSQSSLILKCRSCSVDVPTAAGFTTQHFIGCVLL